jgi:stage V sporulation protein B
VQFQSALIVFLLANNLLMKTDLLLVKAMFAPGDPAAASAAAGAYGAALDFAYIVFQIILSITFVVFPLVSEATFNEDLAVVRGYVRQTLRATLAISALPAALFSANAAEVLKLVYPPEYAVGAGALRIVAVGMLSFAVITVLTSVISSGGRPWVSVAVVAATLALDAGLNVVLIPRFGLEGAAVATSLAMAAGAAACAAFVRVRYGALVSGLTIARVGAAAAAVYALSLLVPSDALFARLGGLAAKGAVAVEFAVLGVVYLALLVALREIGADEWRLARRILGRG